MKAYQYIDNYKQKKDLGNMGNIRENSYRNENEFIMHLRRRHAMKMFGGLQDFKLNIMFGFNNQSIARFGFRNVHSQLGFISCRNHIFHLVSCACTVSKTSDCGHSWSMYRRRLVFLCEEVVTTFYTFYCVYSTDRSLMWLI